MSFLAYIGVFLSALIVGLTVINVFLVSGICLVLYNKPVSLGSTIGSVLTVNLISVLFDVAAIVLGDIPGGAMGVLWAPNILIMILIYSAGLKTREGQCTARIPPRSRRRPCNRCPDGDDRSVVRPLWPRCLGGLTHILEHQAPAHAPRTSHRQRLRRTRKSRNHPLCRDGLRVRLRVRHAARPAEGAAGCHRRHRAGQPTHRNHDPERHRRRADGLRGRRHRPRHRHDPRDGP